MIPIGGIVNANTRSVYDGLAPMPSMRSTLLGWFRPLGLSKVTKSTVGVRTVEKETPLNASGVWQPFTAEQLSLKPEGERSWRWFMVHTTIDVVLVTDDVIVRGTEKFRVMEKLDYTENGFVEYHVINAYDGPGGGS
jgi:hypothetical protein